MSVICFTVGDVATVVVSAICFAFPAAVRIVGLPATIAPSATILIIPPATKFVSCDPSTAGNLELPSNCTALFAPVPAVSVAAVPRPRLFLDVDAEVTLYQGGYAQVDLDGKSVFYGDLLKDSVNNVHMSYYAVDSGEKIILH